MSARLPAFWRSGRTSGADFDLARCLLLWTGMRRTLLVLSLLATGPATGVADAQSEQFDALLAARRDQIALEAFEAEHERSQELARHGLVAATEVERRRADVETARLDLQRTLIDLVDREPYLTAERALKRQTADGRHVLVLTLRNRTPDLSERQRALLRDVGGHDLEQAFANVRADAAFVAIKSNAVPLSTPALDGMGSEAGKTTIALPYETRLPPLARDESVALEFQLLRDVSSVVVAIRHPRGEREIAIELELADTENVGTFSSRQLSLEADLGSRAVFALTLERASVEPRTFRLRTVGLPESVDARFLDGSDGRITRIHFPAGVKRQALGLEILLPDRPSAALPLDRPRAFAAVAADVDDTSLESGADEAAAGRAARLDLAIVPRGVPAIDVRAGSLFEQIEAGAVARTELRLRNAGSRRLDQIALRIDAPPGWRTRLVPASVESLGIGEEVAVAVEAAPPASAESGEFELRLSTETVASNRPVPVADKVFRIRIEPRANLAAGFVTSALFLIMIAAVVVFGLRLARR